jgi:hypothetical protein
MRWPAWNVMDAKRPFRQVQRDCGKSSKGINDTLYEFEFAKD